jgi:phosphinothricin acetyltransferase
MAASPTPSIRPAAPADLSAIFEIYNEQVLTSTATFDTEPKDPERDRDWLDARDARHPALVAEVDGAFAGWAALSPWSPRPAYDRTAEASVYVHPGWRRRGIGTALFKDLLGRASQAGIAVIVGRVAEGNPGSTALVRSFGFGLVGTQRRCGEKFGRVLDVDIYDLHLDT